MTVGRAVGHFVEDLSPHAQGIADYYDSLPFRGKPDIEDCTIHFSALAPSLAGAFKQSIWLETPERLNPRLDPGDKDRPPADIIMFVGSFVGSGSVNQMDTALRGQLSNFARGSSPDPSLDNEVEALKHRLDALQQRRPLKAMERFMARSVLLFDGYLLGDMLLGSSPTFEVLATSSLLTSAAIALLERKIRIDSVVELQKNLAQERQNRAAGYSATEYGDTTIPLISVKPAAKPPKPLSWSVRLGRPVKVGPRHMELSKKPPKRS